MMNSDNLQEYFSDYIDGDLPPQQQQALEEKLRENPEVWATVERMRIIREEMRKLPPISASPDFENRLHQRIQGVATRPLSDSPLANIISWRNAAAVAATVLVVSLSSMFMWQGSEGDSSAKQLPQTTNSSTFNSGQAGQQKPLPSEQQLTPSNEAAIAKAKQDSINAKRNQQLQQLKDNIQIVQENEN